MLFLFDIDHTLLKTSGLGRSIMLEAGLAMLGREIRIDTLDFAGRLDPLILSDLLTMNGVEATPQTLDCMRTHYVERMTLAIESSGRIEALGGAHRLVDALERVEGATLGVLTGNYAPTGLAKLRAAGWDPGRFRISVWGDEAPGLPPTRNQLPGVAIERYLALHGRAVAGERVVVIGDTIHDVACAKAHGCRSVAVATGAFTVDELASAGADLVLDSLEPTEDIALEIMGWMTSPTG
ncbi:MAG: HAD hydrolase-like protein [Salinibacterium sp.]|nr:HAD hydrolase-like protein [Salinibacterium sp.]